MRATVVATSFLNCSPMSYTRLVFVAGFAMFSMFFGSGNLVFPLMIGVKTLDQFHVASIGLMITGVLVPFIGLLSMIYYSGNRQLFFKSLGAPAAFVLTFSMLSLMGPFGVLPRCIIVAHGGVDLIFEGLSAPVFNGVFCAVTAFLAWHRSRIIELIGTFLTPLLLLGIFALIAAGLFLGPAPAPSNLSTNGALTEGLFQGYQTMDLLAAFFFSATTVIFIARALTTHEDKQNLERLSLTACLIGAFLLSLVYLGFVYLGAEYAPVLCDVAPEKLLVVIAEQSLGPLALPLAAIVIALATLTTATILASLFADFLQKDMLQEKIPRWLALIITLIIGYTFSLLGFSDLASWIANALMIAYPALIGYALAKIIAKKTGHKYAREVFWLILLAAIIAKVLAHLGVF